MPKSRRHTHKHVPSYITGRFTSLHIIQIYTLTDMIFFRFKSAFIFFSFPGNDHKLIPLPQHDWTGVWITQIVNMGFCAKKNRSQNFKEFGWKMQASSLLGTGSQAIASKCEKGLKRAHACN